MPSSGFEALLGVVMLDQSRYIVTPPWQERDLQLPEWRTDTGRWGCYVHAAKNCFAFFVLLDMCHRAVGECGVHRPEADEQPLVRGNVVLSHFRWPPELRGCAERRHAGTRILIVVGCTGLRDGR